MEIKENKDFNDYRYFTRCECGMFFRAISLKGIKEALKYHKEGIKHRDQMIMKEAWAKSNRLKNKK